MRYDPFDAEVFPGSERRRTGYPSDSFPMIAHDVMAARNFPFQSWAAANGFRYPRWALPCLALCESAAEAFFFRTFLDRPGAHLVERVAASCGGVLVQPQVQCKPYRLDFVVCKGAFRLAVEIDGMAFHHRKPEQVASDYLRDRRTVASGYTVVRFAAHEAFHANTECWRQVDLILEARG